MAVDAGTALAPGLTLGGVLLGLLITGRREDRRWRRDRRTEAYAAVRNLVGELQTSLTRASYLGQYAGAPARDFDDVLVDTAELRAACTLAEL